MSLTFWSASIQKILTQAVGSTLGTLNCLIKANLAAADNTEIQFRASDQIA